MCGALLALALLSGTATARSARWIHDLSFDSRGRLVAAALGGSRLTIVRLDGNGELDVSFGVNGLIRPRVTGAGAQMVVQADNRILIGGRTGKRTFLRRFLPSGKPDRSFGGHGVVRLPVYGVEKLMVQPDGHIVVLSTITCSAGQCGYTFTRLVILRYTRRGQLASTRLQYSELWGMNAAGMGPKGRFVVAGGDWELEYSSLARFLPGGRFDPSFGGREGLAVDNEDLEDAPAVSGRALAVQPDEKVVLVAGFLPSELVRRNRNGSVDVGFGTGGVVKCGAPPTYGAPNHTFVAVVAEEDGSLLAAGGEAECGLVRYLANGAPDPSFGVGGKVDVEGGGVPHPQALAARAGAGIALAGWDDTARALRVARYTTGGSLDPAFGAGGISSLSIP
jgi:uncharacterized delta-60 repeat protein